MFSKKLPYPFKKIKKDKTMREFFKQFSGKRNKPLDLSRNIYLGIVLFLFGSFFLQALFYSFSVREGIVAEENYHLSLLFLQSHTDGFLLHNSESTLFLGNLQGQPFLYYLIFGKTLLLNQLLPISDYIFLKVLHILLSVGTVFFAFFLFREVTGSKVTHLLALGILTHLLGFVFYAGAIHPFTFLTFLVTGEILFLLRFFKRRNAVSLCIFLCFFFAAPLVSVLAMPVNTVILFILVMHCLRIGFKKLASLSSKQKIIPSLLVLVFGFSVNAAYYGSNYIQYNRLVPECYQVLTFEQCIDGRFPFRDEVEKNAMSAQKKDLLSPAAYLHEWRNLVQERITGISAFQKYCKNQQGESCGFFKGKFFWHETRIFQDPVVKAAITGMLFCSFLGMLVMLFVSLRKFNMPEKSLEGRFLFYLVTIAAFYGFVIFWMDYGAYEGSGHIGFDFHAYRLFPVLPLFSLFVPFFILYYLPERTKPLVAGLLITLFFWSTIPTFLYHNKSGELLAYKENIVSLLRCDELFGYCSIEDSDDWSYCVPDKDWQCLSEKIGPDMMY